MPTSEISESQSPRKDDRPECTCVVVWKVETVSKRRNNNDE
jgi:hypothetical protein